MSDYCKAQVAIPTLNGLTNDDPALAGVQNYIDSGRIVGFTDHQFIPAIPLAPLLQTFLLDRRRERIPRRPRRRLGQGRPTPDLGDRSRDAHDRDKPPTSDTDRAPHAASPDAAGAAGQRRAMPRAFYLMVLPALVLFFVFHTIPVIQGIYYSFTDSPGYGPSNLVGLPQLHRAVHRPAGAARLLVHVPDRRGRDRPGQHRLAGHRGRAQQPDQVQDHPARRLLHPERAGDPGRRLHLQLPVPNSLPALGEKLGIDFLVDLPADQGEHGLDRRS